MSARGFRQRVVVDWCLRCFGIDHTNNYEQRAIRFLEEAIELYQACGAKADVAHKLIDYVFSRAAGRVAQEMGGVGVTLLALANVAGIDLDYAEEQEILRILAKSPEHFAKRNEQKNAAGFNVVEP